MFQLLAGNVTDLHPIIPSFTRVYVYVNTTPCDLALFFTLPKDAVVECLEQSVVSTSCYLKEGRAVTKLKEEEMRRERKQQQQQESSEGRAAQQARFSSSFDKLLLFRSSNLPAAKLLAPRKCIHLSSYWRCDGGGVRDDGGGNNGGGDGGMRLPFGGSVIYIRRWYFIFIRRLF